MVFGGTYGSLSAKMGSIQDIVVLDKEQRKGVVVNVVIPSQGNIKKLEK